MSSKVLTIQGKKILPLDIGYLTESAIKKCEVELSETPETKIKGIRELRSLLKRNVKSKGIDFCEDFLVSFLRRNKYRSKDTQQQILKLVHLFETENMFGGVPDECLDLPSRRFTVLLPQRCQDGCAVLIFRWGLWDPTELPVQQFKQIIVIHLAQALRDPMTQINGFKVICDIEGVTLKHLKYCTPHYLRLLYNGVVNSSPARYKELHFVNRSILFKVTWNIIKPMMSEKMKSRVRFHSTAEELFDYFPRCILPTEYGGDIQDAYMKDWIKRANIEQKKFTRRGQPNYY